MDAAGRGANGAGHRRSASASPAVNNRVRELREQRGWTQTRLGDRLEVSRQTINSIETGKYDPSLPLAFRIAREFDQTIESIFLFDEDDT